MPNDHVIQEMGWIELSEEEEEEEQEEEEVEEEEAEMVSRSEEISGDAGTGSNTSTEGPDGV